MAAARNVSPAASITFLPSRVQLRGELADGRGLAGAVDADDEDHVRLVRAVDDERLGDRRQHALDLACEHGAHLVGADALVEAALRAAPR